MHSTLLVSSNKSSMLQVLKGARVLLNLLNKLRKRDKM